MDPWTPLELPPPSGGGRDDAAVVIGAGPEATAFYVWLTVGRGLPAESVTLLRDPTPAEVRAAVGAAAVGPGGQFWGVVVGPDLPELPALVAAREGPAVWWIDAWDTEPPQVPPQAALVLAPGATRLALGALRGWADVDHDGATTTAELAAWCASAAAALPAAGPTGRPQVRGDAGRVWSLGTEPTPPLGLPDHAPIAAVHTLVAHEAPVRSCFAPVFEQGALPPRITLRFMVAASGRAEQVAIEEPGWAGSALEGCLAEAVRGLAFPLAAGATPVTFPFVVQ